MTKILTNRSISLTENQSIRINGTGTVKVVKGFPGVDGANYNLTGELLLGPVQSSGGVIELSPAVSIDYIIEHIEQLKNKSRCVVVIGSSNAAGVGASTYTGDPGGLKGNKKSPATSWAGLLETALGAMSPDWRVVNVSISGTSTFNSIARFWSDVAPHKPSHVILCTSPLNDGNNLSNFVLNTLELMQLCREIGAKPIIRGGYSYNGHTAIDYVSIKAINSLLDTLDAPKIDHLSILDDGTGKYFNGNFYAPDGLHPNDLGHAALFAAIDLGMFENDYKSSLTNLKGCYRVNTSTTLSKGIELNSVYNFKPIKSYSGRVRLKAPSSGVQTSKAFMMFSTQALRLRNPALFFEIADNNGVSVVSTVNSTVVNAVNDIVVTYNHIKNIVSFYINGLLIGSSTPTLPYSDLTAMSFGSRYDSFGAVAPGFEYTDAQLWNSPLSSEEITEMFKTNYVKQAGLIWDADFTSLVQPNSAMRSKVSNGVIGAVSDGWERGNIF